MATLVNATGTITPAPLTIAANNETQVLGTPEPQFSASFGTFPGGLGPSALDGMLSFTTNAPTGSPGSFKNFAGGVSSSNFDITFVPGTLLVTAANNSLPPVPFSMDQGDTTPAFSFTDPVLASLLLQVSDTSGSGGSAMKKNSSAPTLDENGNPLGNLISFNSSFLEVCRTRANLCRDHLSRRERSDSRSEPGEGGWHQPCEVGVASLTRSSPGGSKFDLSLRER